MRGFPDSRIGRHKSVMGRQPRWLAALGSRRLDPNLSGSGPAANSQAARPEKVNDSRHRNDAEDRPRARLARLVFHSRGTSIFEARAANRIVSLCSCWSPH